jgi:hypothetical protein
MIVKNVISVNPTEFGIENKQIEELIGNLPQIKEERSVFENQFKEVIQMDLNDPKTSKIARELRLKIRDNRTKGIVVWHKTNKEFFLRGGQFVDAIRNAEIAINERMESDLQQIENHFAIIEQKRIDDLRQDRYRQIELYIEFVPASVDFGVISEDEFNKVFNGAKLLRAEAEKEKLRIEQERIVVEKIEREKREADRKEREALERQLEIERKSKEALENELKKKREAEEVEAKKIRDAEILEKKRQEKLKKQPIKNQLNAWVSSFDDLHIPEGLGNDVTANEILSKYSAFKSWAKQQIENL